MSETIKLGWIEKFKKHLALKNQFWWKRNWNIEMFVSKHVDDFRELRLDFICCSTYILIYDTL